MERQNTGRGKFKKYKKFIMVIVWVLHKLPKRVLGGLWNCVNSWKGKLGVILRYCLLKVLASECGDSVYIAPDVELKNMQYMKIGDNVSIHRFSYIDALGGIHIGDNVSIAHNCSIVAFNHTWEDLSVPIKYNPVQVAPIHIEEDVWIGCGCRILAGVTVKQRVVVAAGAVVNHSVESGCLVAGIPAQVIKAI